MDDLLSGNFGAVPDNSFGLSHVHLNALQPSRNGGTASLEGAANCAADLALLDTMPWDCDLELAPATMKTSLSVNALLGKRVRIETGMPRLELHGKRSRAAAMEAFEKQVRAAVAGSAPLDVLDTSTSQPVLHHANFAAGQMGAVTDQTSGDSAASQTQDIVSIEPSEADWKWFVRLQAAYAHESVRKESMNFDQGYRHAIQAMREPPFESDSQRESCELVSGMLELLFEQFGPLRLLQLDIYEHLGIQDPIRNLEIIYKVAGDDYHRFLDLAFPPYDFSLQYEEDREYQEQQLANFQEVPSAFDFESLYSGSGATGSGCAVGPCVVEEVMGLGLKA